MTLVVRAGRLVEGGGARAPPPHVLVVEGERVAAVLPAAQAEGRADLVPPSAEVVDLSGCTVLPGLIDLHTHLVGPVEAGEPASVLQRSAADEVLMGVPNARATVAAGFTTVRDVGSFRAFTDVALRDAVRAGSVVGPRMFCAGAYITVTGGGGAVTGLAAGTVLPEELRVGEADTPDEVRRAARRILAGGADLLKVVATGAVLAPGTEPGSPELSEEQLRAAVEVARDAGTHVAAHAHGAEGAKRAARAGVRTLEHGSLLDDEALDLLGEHGVWLVADVYNGDWIHEVGTRDGWPAETMRKNTDTTQAQRDLFARAVDRGLRIAYGTDAGVYPHGLNARQLPVMVRLGMTPLAALRSATVDAARVLDAEADLGSLRPGRYADLVAVPTHDLGDLTVLQHPTHVLASGTWVSCV